MEKARPAPRKSSAARAPSLTALAVLLTALSYLGAAPPVASSPTDEERPPATWLITRDGQRIDLARPWRLDGRRVLFETEAGTLSMARASEIDLEASRQPAEQPVSHTSPVEPSDVEPALVLTDGDVARYAGTLDASQDDSQEGPDSATSEDETDAAEAPGEARAGASTPEASAQEEQLIVDSWRDLSQDSNNVMIHGTLRNRGTSAAKRVFLKVVLLDEAGKTLASQTAKLYGTDIAPGKTSNFQAALPATIPYTSVEFEVGQQ